MKKLYPCMLCEKRYAELEDAERCEQKHAKTFKVGDVVVWTSQARGSSREKVGEVVEVVPVLSRPSRERFERLYRHSGCGYGRTHESYVVLVGNRPYWPNVKHLTIGHGLARARATVAARKSEVK